MLTIIPPTLRQPNFLNAENQAQKKPVMSKYQKKF